MGSSQQMIEGNWRGVMGRGVLWGMRIAAALLVVLATVVAVLVVWLRVGMQHTMPVYDGELRVAGLKQPVEVRFDEHGVPFVSAQNEDDLVVAQGYLTAQERLFQMDALRRHGAGELAEILGSTLLGHDRVQRTLGLRRVAEQSVSTLDAGERGELEAYARGVNAYIATHKGRWGLEFDLLHYEPRPWTPVDSLVLALVLNQDLATEYPHKLNRELLTRHLDPELARDLYPVGSARDRIPGQAVPDLSAPKETVEEIPLDATQSTSVAPADLQRVQRELTGVLCAECVAGSNNWAVAGRFSASGAPLVENDMHLALAAPAIWYEIALSAPGVSVRGFSLPGTPFVIAGRNDHVAWGFTNLGGDVQDVYVEATRGADDAMQYEAASGDWLPVQHAQETIHVRGGKDVVLDVPMTQHGRGDAAMETPVISGLYPSEKRVLALAWNVYAKGAIHAPFGAVAKAASGAELEQSLRNFAGPSLNLVWGDDGGHIGYHVVGKIPVRGPAVKVPRLAQAESAVASSEDEESEAQSGGEDTTPVHDGRRRSFAVHRTTNNKDTKVKEAPAPLYDVGSAIAPVPVTGTDASQQWSGWIPYDDLPKVTDPAEGFLATANARVTADAYPYHIANDWADAYRVERIALVLDAKTHSGVPLTRDAMLALAMDEHSDVDRVIAERFAYAVDHSALAAKDKRLQAAANVLRQWDGAVKPESAGAAVETAARQALMPRLLAAKIREHDGTSTNAEAIAALYTWKERSTAVETLLIHEPKQWLPKDVTSWDDLLVTVLRDALNRAPHDVTTWRYAEVHHVAVNHALLGAHGVLGVLLGVRFGTGPQALGGDASTVHATGEQFGPSEHFVADMASPDAAAVNVPSGESGHPAGAHYLDQYTAWRDGVGIALPRSPAGGTVLTLRPEP